MSILDRLRGIRQESSPLASEGVRTEASKRIWTSTAYKNAPPTFVSDFITEGAWLRDIMAHRGKMARRNACAYNMTIGLAHNVYDDGFIFVDKEDPEKEIMQDVLKTLESLDHLKYLSLAKAGELTYGHTWLFVGPEDMDFRVGDITPDDQPRIAKLDVFTPEMCEVVEYDEIGRPKTLDLFVLTNAGKGSPIDAAMEERVEIDIDDCIPFRRVAFDRSHEGTPITYSVWNALVGLELIFHSITTYAMKVGLGALILTTKGAISSEDADNVKTMMEELSVSRVGVVPGRAVESLEYKGAAGSSVNFNDYIDAFLDQIAAGSKIPRDVLTGNSAGAITGSEVNSRALYAVIQGEQTKDEVYIRELVRRIGHPTDDYDIKWNVRYATDERMAAEIRVLNAQADEAEARMENMKKGIGPNDMAIRFKEQKENKNPAGAQ